MSAPPDHERPPPSEAEHQREREIAKEVVDPPTEARARYPFRGAEGGNTSRNKTATLQTFNMSLMDILSSRGSALDSGAILRDSGAHACYAKATMAGKNGTLSWQFWRTVLSNLIFRDGCRYCFLRAQCNWATKFRCFRPL